MQDFFLSSLIEHQLQKGVCYCGGCGCFALGKHCPLCNADLFMEKLKHLDLPEFTSEVYAVSRTVGCKGIGTHKLLDFVNTVSNIETP